MALLQLQPTLQSATPISSPSIRHGPLQHRDRFDKVSVNIAKSVQTVPLTLNVFKFGELSDLIGPEYKYTFHGSASTNQTYLSFVFNTTSVYTNKTVSAGDHLGLSIAGLDFAPYCHLEYDVGSSSDHVLLQQGSGQNS